MSSGGSVVAGYKYFVKMILGLTTGRVDSVRGSIFESRKLAMPAIPNGITAKVDQPDLFGGDGYKGGIVADMTLVDGSPEQVVDFTIKSSVLFSQLRGVSAVLFNGTIGNIPYLNDMLFSVQRIYKRSFTDQWYPETAAVPLGQLQLLIPVTAVWNYRISIDPSHFSEGFLPETLPPLPNAQILSAQGPFGNNNPLWEVPHIAANELWPKQTACILQRTIVFNGVYDVKFTIKNVENSAVGYLDGNKIFEVNANNSQIVNGPGYSGVVSIPIELASAGSHDLVIWCRDEPEDFEQADVTHIEIQIEYDQVEYAMNPAHIILEVLTEPWGLNLSESDIDLDSFTSVANTLFADGFGLCLTLDKEQTLENFLQEILSTSDLTLFQNQTGKWQLRLIRQDYITEELPIYNETNIFQVTQYSEPNIQTLVSTVIINYTDYQSGAVKVVTAVNSAIRQILISDNQVTRNYRGIPTQKLATVVAKRDLQVLSTPLCSVTFTTNKLCYPGDVIRFKWSEYSVEKLLRVLNVGFPSDGSSVFTVICSEESFSTPNLIDIDIPDTTTPETYPSNMQDRLIFEANYYLLSIWFGQYTLDQYLANNPNIGRVTAVCKRQTGQIDARLFSFDNTWLEIGTVNFTKYGTLVNNISRFDFEINLLMDLPLTLGDLIVIGAETVLFAEEPNIFKRGMFDSIPQNHIAGDPAYALYNYTISSSDRLSGEIVDYTLCGNTGSAVLNPALGIVSTVTFANVAIRPYSPGNIKINGEYEPTSVIGEFVISWSNRNRTLTTTQVDWFSDNVTAETGQQTKISIWINDIFYQDFILDATETEISVDPTITGTLRLEISSIRDGYTSLYTNTNTFGFVFANMNSFMANSIFPKLEHWFPMSESDSSQTLLDLIGGAEYLYSGSGVTLSAPSIHGVTGTSMLFDGGFYFTYGINQWFLNGVRNVGFSLWIKPTTTTSTELRDIVAHSFPSDTSSAENFAHSLRIRQANNSLEEFHEYGTGTNIVVQAGPQQLTLNPNFLTVFIDGINKRLRQSINSAAFVSNSFARISEGGNDTSVLHAIGKNSVSNTPALSYFQDLMFLNSLLTPEENTWLYNSGEGRTYDEFRSYLTVPLTWSPSNIRNKIVWFSSDNSDNVITSGRVTLIANKVGHSSAQVVNNSTQEFRADLSTLDGKTVFIGQPGNSGRYNFPNTEKLTNSTTGFTIAVLTQSVISEPVENVIKHIVTIPAANSSNLVALSRNGITPNNNFHAECKRVYSETGLTGRDTFNHNTNWRIVLLNVNYTTGVADLRVNGSVESNIGLTTGAGDTDNSPYAVSIGGNAYDSISENLNYGMAELIVLNRPCTIPECEKLEGYLAHRWGMGSQLVEGHTWRFEPPVI